MEILFDSIRVDKPSLNYEKVALWLNDAAIDNNRKIKELSIVYCDDDYILEVNKKFLNHDFYTDIITFDYSKKSYISGDLLISLDTVRSNAQKYKTDFSCELCRVMVHGVLHLLGFNDHSDDEKKLMRQKEDYYLEKLSKYLC
ncbi:MAG: rRNA maturation RNase YbeY [Cytophagaceae bacterium]|nr:rRNA maturation RNase YbeY [Cytophagaceae bacterium]